jgi:hypothetical protein
MPAPRRPAHWPDLDAWRALTEEERQERTRTLITAAAPLLGVQPTADGRYLEITPTVRAQVSHGRLYVSTVQITDDPAAVDTAREQLTAAGWTVYPLDRIAFEAEPPSTADQERPATDPAPYRPLGDSPGYGESIDPADIPPPFESPAARYTAPADNAPGIHDDDETDDAQEQPATPLGTYVAWAEGPQERTEHGYLVAEHGGEALVLGLDGTYRRMPANIPEPDPDPQERASTAYLASLPARGPGLDQATARRRARELEGIAAAAHKDSAGRWSTDGWPTDQTAWIVTSLAGRIILDDGHAPATDRPAPYQ